MDSAQAPMKPAESDGISVDRQQGLRPGVAQSAGFNDTFGPRTLAQVVSKVDAQLRKVSGAFEFILQCTPVNRTEAWQTFRESGYQREPAFRYRPLAATPTQLKRQLYRVELEHIDDPTVEFLLREKQEELDHQIGALRDIESRNFHYSSLQLFGRPSESLVHLAQQLIREVNKRAPPTTQVPKATPRQVEAQAQVVIEAYQRQDKASGRESA
jgi:hypothetical protein